MYVLNKYQLNLVSGGQSSILDWKEGEILAGATILGIVGTAMGGMIGLSSGSVVAVLAGGAIGGATGFSIGFGLNFLMNASLENTMWYDFNYSTVVFAA